MGLLSTWPASGALAGALVALSLLVLADRHRVRAALAWTAVFALAIAHGAAARDRVLASSLGQWFDTFAGDEDRQRAPVLVRGVIARDAAAVEYGVRVLVDVERVVDDRSVHDAAGRIQATVSGTLAADALGQWVAGRTIEAPMLLRRPATWRNPGGQSVQWQTLRRPFTLAGTIKSAALVRVEPRAWWHETAAAIRRLVRRQLTSCIAAYDRQSAAIATAILIGDRAGLADDVEQRLQSAGTYHVIAISGGNVAVITALVFVVLRQLFRSAVASHLVAAAIVIAYGWVVGGEPSVARAVTAGALYLVLGAFGLRARPVVIVAVVALLLIALDPLIVIDVGAWLSFGATLAIILSGSRFADWIRRRRRPPMRLRDRVAAIALLVLGATLAAEIALLPIAASVFGQVGAAGLVLNFIAIPAMTVVQLTGIAIVLIGAVSDVASLWLGWIAHLAARALVDSSFLVEVAPWLVWRTTAAPLLWTASYYAFWIAFLARQTSDTRRRVLLAGALLVGVGLLWGPITGAAPRAGWMRLTWLDVGQADAALVQFPTGQSLLVDTGGGGAGFDVGSRVIAPAARALGIRRLDWLLLTHADVDHAGGALSTAVRLRPLEIWEGIPVPPNPIRRVFRDATIHDGIAWRRLSSGHVIEIGPVLLEVLHPPPAQWERQRVRNDDSVVIRLRYGDVEVLLTGDAGAEFESAFAPDLASAPLRILKVAHHGSRSSSSPAFLRAYQPDIAVVSAGRGNLFGHPAPEVLHRLNGIRAALFRTDRDGAVTLETNGRTIEMTTASGRRRGFVTGALF